MSKKSAPKKKAVSKSQAMAVADLLKSQKSGANGSGTNNSGAAMPTPKSNPVTSANDNDEDDQE